MDAIEIFKKIIGEKLRPLVIKYDPYKDVFITYPYRHVFDDDFEQNFSDIMFDSIVFYAYDKDEIENDYRQSRLNNLRKASRRAYEDRVPKTEKLADGLLGELTLDSFIKLFFPNIEMLYSRVKYLPRYPHKEEVIKESGQEVKGFDGMLFSIEENQKYFWLGQVKTGGWQYCLDDIKKDINKSLIKYYFGDAIAILCDVMRSVNSTSKELNTIINNINNIIFDSNDRQDRVKNIINYFKDNNIKTRIPCLIMPNEENYINEEVLLKIVKNKLNNAFKDFCIKNEENIDVEILLLVFPIRNLSKVRQNFLEVRRNGR